MVSTAGTTPRTRSLASEHVFRQRDVMLAAVALARDLMRDNPNKSETNAIQEAARALKLLTADVYEAYDDAMATDTGRYTVK